MIYEYPAVLTPFEDGAGFLADVPDLNACTTSGCTVDDALDMITDAMSLWLLVQEDLGLEIPPATDFEQFRQDHDGIIVRVMADTDEYRAMLELYPPDESEDEEEA